MELEGLGQKNEINNILTKPVPKTAEGLQLQKENNVIPTTIHCLPYEMLICIFDYAVRERCKCRNTSCSGGPASIPLSEGYIHIDRRHRPIRPPSYKSTVVLSSVCSYWRRIIIDLSSFWTRVELPANYAIVKMILRRSRGALLDVSVQLRSRYSGDDQADVACINSFLAENMHRIERLSLGTSGFRRITLPDTNTSAPFLKYICINTGTYQEIATAHLQFKTSRLEDILLCGITIPISSYQILGHVQRLTLTTSRFQRSYEAWSAHDVVRILSYCKGTIVELECESTRISSPQDFKKNSLIILPQLRRLVWNAFKFSPSLLDFIVTPAIQTLHVQSSSEPSQIVPSSLVRLSKRLPGVLEVYHQSNSPGVGINLYLDSSRKEKLFAFNYSSFHRRQERWENGSRVCTCGVDVLATFVEAQKLPSVKSARLSSDAKVVKSRMLNILRLLPNVGEVDLWDVGARLKQLDPNMLS